MKILSTWVALLLLIAQSACATGPIMINEWEEQGYNVTIKDVPRHTLVSFEWEVVVEAPPWRVWNMMLDIENSITMSPGVKLLKGPILENDGTVTNIVEFNPRWYMPAVTSVLSGKRLPGKLAWEDECIGGSADECYLQFQISPFHDGNHSVVRVTGYMQRPWFVSFGMMAAYIPEGAKGFAERANLLVRQNKYANPDQTYPWEQINVLSQAASREAVRSAVQEDKKRPRLAINRLQAYGDAQTDSVLASVAGDYLAYAVLTTNRYEVTTPDDLELMARYLGENWSLLCADDDCKTRIVKMSDADYLLTGKLRRSENQYELNLVMLDSRTGNSVWRIQKSVSAEIEAVKSALDDAANALGTTVLN